MSEFGICELQKDENFIPILYAAYLSDSLTRLCQLILIDARLLLEGYYLQIKERIYRVGDLSTKSARMMHRYTFF